MKVTTVLAGTVVLIVERLVRKARCSGEAMLEDLRSSCQMAGVYE